MRDEHIHLPESDVSPSNVTLFIDTALVVEDHIYFVTCNESKLFKTDFSGNVEVIASLPVLVNNESKFQSMQYINEKIWILPWTESKIFVYDINIKKLYVLPVPYEMTQCNDVLGFRSCIKLGNDLWLLPNKYKALVKIDTISYKYEVFHMPDTFDFPINDNCNFTMMCDYCDYLYLFGEEYNRNLKFNYLTGKYEAWNNKSNRDFDTIINDKLYLSYINKNDKFNVYDLESGCLVIPHKGNTILFINNDGVIVKTISLYAHINADYQKEILYKRLLVYGVIREEQVSMEVLLQYIEECNLLDWQKNQKNHINQGKRIYEIIDSYSE